MKKRYLTLLVALFATLCLVPAGCSNSADGPSEESSSSTEAEQEDEFGDGQAITEEIGTVLVDDEFCTITAVDSFETPSVAGFDLEIVNKTDSRLDVRMTQSSATIGGKEFRSSFSTAEAVAGATETSVLSFYKPDLGGGIDKLQDVKFQLEAVKLPDAESVATYDLQL